MVRDISAPPFRRHRYSAAVFAALYAAMQYIVFVNVCILHTAIAIHVIVWPPNHRLYGLDVVYSDQPLGNAGRPLRRAPDVFPFPRWRHVHKKVTFPLTAN